MKSKLRHKYPNPGELVCEGRKVLATPLSLRKEMWSGPFFVQLRFQLPPQIPDDEACDGFPCVCGVTMKGDVLLSLHVRQASPQEKKC